MKNNKCKLFCCCLLCSLFFCACGQGTELPQLSALMQSENLSGSLEKEETQNTPMPTKEKETLPDLSKVKWANQALALLIKDEGFRACVRYGIGIKKEYSPETALQLLESCEGIVLEETSRDSPIHSLKALSLLPNLKWLEIDISEWDNSVITDFTPIMQLSQLEQLTIRYGKGEVTDLSFLGEMHTITELYLTGCDIADISFLEQMPQLQRLSLYETPVEDLAVLGKLPELVELALCGNENAKHMEVVGTLTKMQDLGVQYCGIEDISFLSGLTELRAVNLNGNSVTDITPLADLEKLERLGLAGNSIRDISALGKLKNLYELALDGNEIQDISALAEIPHLNQAGLSYNQIEDLSPLVGKEELMYAAVSGNPIKSLKPVWEVPLLLYADIGVSEEEETFIADWFQAWYPEVTEFESIDFIQGDLNKDGLQDVAFVVDSDVFDVYEEDFPERMPETRRMFILLQQGDGSWAEQKNVPELWDRLSGGMRGDPYRGIFMEEGYLLVKEGWGSGSGGVETEIYEYRSGELRQIEIISVLDYVCQEGYCVRLQYEQDVFWKNYVIAMDGYRMVRVDTGDTEHPENDAFPNIDLFDMSFIVHHEKAKLQITSSEALDRVCAAAAEDAVREELPYADWQKEGYELLLGIELPDYYYILPGTGENASSAEGYIYYYGMKNEDGRLCHEILLNREHEHRRFLLEDATGEIEEIT